MDDLISRKALLEKAWEADTQCGYVQVVDVGDIEDAPTIDPVHAAGACYCRECTCWNRHDDILPDGGFPDWGYYSKMLDSDSEIEITTLENDFCSWGQRREDLQ